MNAVKGRYTTGLDSWLSDGHGVGGRIPNQGTDEEADELLTSRLEDRMNKKKDGHSSDESLSMPDLSGHIVPGARVQADR